MSLKDYLPRQYLDSQEVGTVMMALNDAAEELWTVREDFAAQIDVNTATWGLALWESALGLATDVSRPLDWRRSRVVAKLRGQGTTTVAMIKNLAESFSNGTVEVLEHPAEYRFAIKFVGTIGVPPNMDDLTAAIEEIKPAHLDYDYIILFRTHAQLKKYTHAQLKKYTHDTLRAGAIA